MSVSRRRFLAATGTVAAWGPGALAASREARGAMVPGDGPERAAPIVESLRSALPDGQPAMEEELRRLTTDPGRIVSCLGEPTRGGITKLYHDSEVTILQIVWAPLMVLRPHDHNMWATVGVYAGREDNIYWERKDQQIRPVGASSLPAGAVGSMGGDGVHSVINPVQKLTAAIHVYGGDFFAPGRTSWAGEDQEPVEFSQEGLLQHFEDSNARFDL